MRTRKAELCSGVTDNCTKHQDSNTRAPCATADRGRRRTCIRFPELYYSLNITYHIGWCHSCLSPAEPAVTTLVIAIPFD